MSLTLYAKKFLAMHLAYDEFRHILRETKKPIKVFTDRKALTGFFTRITSPINVEFL